MSKRIVSLLLIFAMLITLFSVTATAAEEKKVNGETFTLVKTEAEFAEALREAREAGVQIFAVCCRVEAGEVVPEEFVPVLLPESGEFAKQE